MARAAARPRAAIVGGVRTPFCKAGTDLRDLDVLDLAHAASVELLARLELDPRQVDAVVFGNVVRPVKYHNLAREVVLSAGLPRSVPAWTVSLACASACRALTDAVAEVERSYAHAVLAGGSESLSNLPLGYQPRLARVVAATAQARSLPARVQTLATLRPADLLPEAPAIAETSTGLTMGQSAELMARENGIGRQAQDAFALRSHQRAAAAWDDGRLAQEVAPVYVAIDGGRAVTQDNHIRRDTSAEKLAALPPVFDRAHGTVTAGNSSPLTDGAAAVLVLSEERARALGYAPRAFVRSYAYAAVDPAWQLLMGPAFAIPLALERAGVTLQDIDLVEMHEAFAAQVLSTLQALASREFAERELGRASPVGEIDPDRLNVAGGSIALGHPFGATGARLALSLANELERRDAQLGLLSVCAAGGVGCAIVLERV
ncbi:MAG: acetyl-CoA C-acyltransferase [Chloroflexi bacterium]|nr:acetyl-CoA C-acyltransferase [Chloroflexota bacterium]